METVITQNIEDRQTIPKKGVGCSLSKRNRSDRLDVLARCPWYLAMYSWILVYRRFRGLNPEEKCGMFLTLRQGPPRLCGTTSLTTIFLTEVRLTTVSAVIFNTG
jgi:hypothetical protein